MQADLGEHSERKQKTPGVVILVYLDGLVVVLDPWEFVTGV
jgi:hypothetical protein